MKRTLLVKSAIFAAITLGAHAAGANETKPPKERYRQAMHVLDSDARGAMTDLTALCSEGYARACDRAGYLTFKGIGAAQDTGAALAFYQKAIDAGRTGSLVSMGKVLLTSGAHQKAIEALTQAAAAGHEKADATLAWAHATKRLGDLSDATLGVPVLRKMAQSKQRDAELYLLDALSRAKDKRTQVDHVLDNLQARWTDGDSKAAEALLRYYRMVGHKNGTLELRAALLETPGLRDKIRVEEALYLSSVRKPGSFWTDSEQLVGGAPDEVFARALVVSAKINKNAYVRIVQKELRTLGYPVGRASPYMNRPLIRSINAFCRDAGQSAICRAGPLKSATIKAVASHLAEIRAAS